MVSTIVLLEFTHSPSTIAASSVSVIQTILNVKENDESSHAMCMDVFDRLPMCTA